MCSVGEGQEAFWFKFPVCLWVQTFSKKKRNIHSRKKAAAIFIFFLKKKGFRSSAWRKPKRCGFVVGFSRRKWFFFLIKISWRLMCLHNWRKKIEIKRSWRLKLFLHFNGDWYMQCVDSVWEGGLLCVHTPREKVMILPVNTNKYYEKKPNGKRICFRNTAFFCISSPTKQKLWCSTFSFFPFYFCKRLQTEQDP